MQQGEIKKSPWGMVQQIKVITDGIVFVSTASHGGLKLDRGMNKRVPDYMRRKGGWYEEDCEAAIPVIALKEYFSESEYRSAVDTLMRFYPDSFERLFCRIVPPGMSYQKDQAAFFKEHANSLVGICGWGDWKKGVPKGSVLVLARTGGKEGPSAEKERYFLVEAQRYDASFPTQGILAM